MLESGGEKKTIKRASEIKLVEVEFLLVTPVARPGLSGVGEQMDWPCHNIAFNFLHC